MNNIRKKTLKDESVVDGKEPNVLVLAFIYNFINHQPNIVESKDILINQFSAGYCYHFASILQTIFKRGQICWTAPYGHMVWQDIDGICYDITGVYHGDADLFIPVWYIGAGLIDFLAIPGQYYEPTKEKINGYIKNYLMHHPEKITPKYEYLITREEVEEYDNMIEDLMKNYSEIEDKYGYYIHGLTNDDGYKVVSFHTHGLLRNSSHPELEIIVVENMEEISRYILNYLADSIKGFSTFLKNKEYDISINGKIIYIKALLISDPDINNAPYYRIIIRDPNGKYPWDNDCDEAYKVQWTVKDDDSYHKLMEY